MKKVVIVALFVLATIGFASADILTGNTTVTASLASVLEVKNVTASTTFTLNILGEAAKSIGSANFYTNRKNWSVTVHSANAGNLHAVDGATTYDIPYWFTMSNSNLGTLVNDLSLSSDRVATLAKRTTPALGTDGDLATMTIRYGTENVNTWFAGLSYTDTITITVAAL